LIFRQITHDDLGCASYVIGDEDAGVAAVVDPRLDIHEYLRLARYLGVRIEHVLETHNHADHVSGHGRLARATGATIHIHELAAAEYEHEPFADGLDHESLDLGDGDGGRHRAGMMAYTGAMQPPADAPPGLFPETRWTLVLAARLDPEKRRPALESLVRPRWKALYVVARKHGLAPAEAEDAVQGFVTRLLEGDVLARLDPGRGRLRSYLRTAFRHYLSSQREEERAQKRGGGERPVDLADVEAWVESPGASPEALFDRAWALSLFSDALSELHREYQSGARRGPFEVVEELFQFGAAPPYAELAVRHQMSVPQLKAFVHRARVRFRELLRSRVAETLTDSDDPDDELAALLQVMAA
jgi:RNA polymerase sigma-70 factor (ECF subfamily)